MKRTIKYLLLTLLAAFLFSCEKNVELLTDYEDITIVYGLIDPADSVSYLRIEKAYLTDGDVFESAQIQDSNQYSYKLDVKLITNNRTITFDTTTVTNKEGGIFYAPRMQVYYAVTKGLLADKQTCNLEITNPRTGKIISASTVLIDASNPQFSYPNLTIDFTKGRTVRFSDFERGVLYGLNIRFHYIERNIISGDSIPMFADWVFPNVEYISSTNKELEFPYLENEFYNNLLAVIPFKENVERYNGQVELIVSVADNNLNTYMEVNAPSTSLVIDRPTYTNIENGYGLFASRGIGSKFVSLSIFSILELKSYDQLNFQ
jgi:hypothetical protein